MKSTTSTSGIGDSLIFTRKWSAEAPVASVILIHGINEHTGRYEHLGEQFNEAGLNVSGPDLPGFGHSGGPRAYVPTWDTFLDVVEEQLAEARTQGLPVVLYGHSMGGLICLSYALSGRPQPDLLVLSAPAIDADVPKWQRVAAPLLSKIAPKLGIPAEISGPALSRDEAVGEAYFADPLRTPRDSTLLGALLFSTMDQVQSSMKDLDLTTYVLHGGADPLVLPQFSAPLGELPTVTRRLYPTLRHETHNEPEQVEVMADTIEWILANL